MKRIYFILLLICGLSISAFAQVTTIPAIVQKGYTGEIKVIFNPAEGNGGMASATKCYAHTGLITSKSTSSSDWQYATATWRGSDTKYQMTKDGSNWVLTIPNIYTYYGCPESEEILKLAFVFNDGPSGSLEGKTADGGDIFVTLADAGLSASITTSATELMSQGSALSLTCNATSSATLTLSLNGEVVKTTTGTAMDYSTTLSSAQNYLYTLKATTATEEATDTLLICVAATAETATRPSGVDNGIYYNTSDFSKVTLCTYAASKTEPAQHVFVVGDFNNWQIDNNYQLKRDGNYFWIELTGLTPQKEYAYQYVVVRADGKIVRIDDLYATKVLHPDDKYEPKTVDPTLKDYPEKGESYVSVLQTNKPAFAWSDATLNFQRPDKNNLIIYELWVYDYSPLRSIKAITKRLDYIANLGVNAVELMPICEFDGNYNWGYSPNHYFAPDRAYGSENDIKTFIDECHKRGLAVIMDMVFNHATGNNPMNKLYPYGTDLSSNPWFNVTAPHSDNVYEDWNHDFAPAKTMFTRALQYWLTEYKVDGYRMDLSHGLCGADCSNLMTNLSDYYTQGVQAASSGAYFILEHWGSSMSTQRPTLVSQGMLCWQNTSNAYCQTAMGWLTDGDSFIDASTDGYVSYCESHDEERCFYKAKMYGNGDLKTNETTRLNRIPANVAFNVLLNGPHMLWQYEELGFDYSINSDENGEGTSTDNRCTKKMQPERLGWFQNSLRMEQYKKVAQIIQLRTQLLPDVFKGNPTSATIGSGVAVRSIAWGSGSSAVYAVANFDATSSKTATLPSGTWYDYLAGSSSAITSTSITLAPGELKIYTASKLEMPTVPSTYSWDDYVGLETVTAQESSKYIYPTLAEDMVYIASDKMPSRIQVYSINGALVKTACHTSELNVSDLKQGLYLMVTTFDKTQEAFKFIKK